MDKDMNVFQFKVSKMDLYIGAFISIIVMFIFSYKIASLFFFGLIISLLNYWISSYAVRRWIQTSRFNIAGVTVLRITVIVGITILFINHASYVVSYIAGFTLHNIILIYCTIMEKGSA